MRVKDGYWYCAGGECYNGYMVDCDVMLDTSAYITDAHRNTSPTKTHTCLAIYIYILHNNDKAILEVVK